MGNSILKQEQFAAFCRTGQENATVLEQQGLYRTMVMQNFDNTLLNTFPLAHKALGDTLWTEMIHRFVDEFKCQESQFWKMPQSLIEFEEAIGFGRSINREWLNDLLQFEWVQYELYFRKNWEPVNFDPFTGDLSKKIILHDEFEILQLEYPVHTVKWEELETNKGNFFILVYRNPKDFSIQLLELSPFLAIFTELLREGSLPAIECLKKILFENKMELSARYIGACQDFLHQLNDLGIVKGDKS